MRFGFAGSAGVVALAARRAVGRRRRTRPTARIRRHRSSRSASQRARQQAIFKGAKDEVKAGEAEAGLDALLPRRHRLRQDDRPARSGPAPDRRRSEARQMVRPAPRREGAHRRRSARRWPPKTEHKAELLLGRPEPQLQQRQQRRARLRLRLLPDRPLQVRLSVQAARLLADRGAGAAAARLAMPAQAERTAGRRPDRHLRRRHHPTSAAAADAGAGRGAGRGRRQARRRATPPACRSCGRSRSRSTARAASSTGPADLRREEIQPATEADARRSLRRRDRRQRPRRPCRSASPPSRPSRSRRSCSPSTARAENGHKLILAQAYARKPPGASSSPSRQPPRAGASAPC